RASKEAGEKLWQLPLVKEYREDIKSSVADMKNIGGSYGGAIGGADPAGVRRRRAVGASRHRRSGLRRKRDAFVAQRRHRLRRTDADPIFNRPQQVNGKGIRWRKYWK